MTPMSFQGSRGLVGTVKVNIYRSEMKNSYYYLLKVTIGEYWRLGVFQLQNSPHVNCAKQCIIIAQHIPSGLGQYNVPGVFCGPYTASSAFLFILLTAD